MLPGHILLLSLVSPLWAAASGADLCVDAGDQTSLIVMHQDGPDMDVPALQPRQEARGPGVPPVAEAQRRGWGRRRAPGKQLAEVGDGRLMSRDPADLQELSEDAEEEDELEREAEVRHVTGASGSTDATLGLPPLEPRVRDIFGCLLEGRPVKPEVTLGSPVLIINLDSRPDRWASLLSALNTNGVQRIMRKFSLEVNRWSATQLQDMTDVETLPEIEDSSLSNTDLRKYISEPKCCRGLVSDKIEHASPELASRRNSTSEDVVRGFFAALNCFLSHLRAVAYLHLSEQARITPHAPIAYLVMEDDWFLSRDIVGLLPDVVQAVRDENWDVIRLDCWGYGGWTRRRQREEVRKELGWPNRRVLRTSRDDEPHFGGSHAILYRRESLPKVLEFFQDEPLRPVDDMFWTDKLQTYCVNWQIARHFLDSGSNVSARKELLVERRQEDEAEAVKQLQRQAHLKKCRKHRSERLQLSQQPPAGRA